MSSLYVSVSSVDTGCRSGRRLAYELEAAMQPFVASGTVGRVLVDRAAIRLGYRTYYPSQRQVPTGCHLLVALIRELPSLGR